MGDRVVSPLAKIFRGWSSLAFGRKVLATHEARSGVKAFFLSMYHTLLFSVLSLEESMFFFLFFFFLTGPSTQTNKQSTCFLLKDKVVVIVQILTLPGTQGTWRLRQNLMHTWCSCLSPSTSLSALYSTSGTFSMS